MSKSLKKKMTDIGEGLLVAGGVVLAVSGFGLAIDDARTQECPQQTAACLEKNERITATFTELTEKRENGVKLGAIFLLAGGALSAPAASAALRRRKPKPPKPKNTLHGY